jgi:polar amino acid transport system substrate-binding protein
MAHEINNPNSVALLNTPIVLEAYQDCREILEEHYRRHGDFTMGGLDYSMMREEVPLMLSEMLDGARRIKRIVEDLKDFARKGNASLDETVDLHAVIGTAVRLVDNSIRKATQRFELHFAEGLPSIRGNAQRIEQVVLNLILNACQALPGPEKGIFLSTRQSPGRDFVLFEVRDEGCGIAPEHFPHLTDPFFTTKRETGGTGLGLSVSAAIVQEHGGTLEFASAPGRGTTATLSLPVFRKTVPYEEDPVPVL